MNILPIEVQQLVFTFLEAKELCRTAQVSKAFQRLSNQCWESFFFRKFTITREEYQKGPNFKALYKENLLRQRNSNWACDY